MRTGSVMTSFADLSMQKKIALIVLVIVSSGLGIFSWLGVRSVNESVDRTLNERLTVARIMATHLDETLRYIQVQLQEAGNNSAAPIDRQFELTAKSLRQMLGNSGIAIGNIILTDAEGVVIQAEPGEPRIIGMDLSAYVEVRQSMDTGLPAISGLLSIPVLEAPVVLVTTPVMDEHGDLTGILIAAIDIEQSSDDAFSPTLTIGMTGYTEVVDGNGIVLARSRPGSPPNQFERSDHPGRFADLINQGTPIVRTCHRCHESGDTLKRRRDVLAFYPLTTASWGIAIRQPEEEALAPTRQLQQRLFLLGTIVLISALSLVWAMTAGIIKPVKAITAAARRMAEGDFNEIIPIRRQDEVGQLSNAFYAMTQEIIKSRNELVLRNEQLKTYAKYVVHAQENERQRIALELHDGIVQSLMLLCRRLYSLQDANGPLPELVDEAILETKNTTEEVIKDLRNVIKALRPPIMDDLGMVAAAGRHLKDFSERTQIICQLKVIGEEQRLTSEIELAVFRILQEAMRNAELHAKATRVEVTIIFNQDELTIKIVDNGIGFSPKTALHSSMANGHLGLLSMQERAGSVGGELEIHSKPGKGTTIIASVPIKYAHHDMR